MASFDEQYFNYLVDSYSQSMQRLAYTYLKNIQDAEDIAREVLLSILNNHPVFNDVNHEMAWILRVTINRCLNVLKSAEKRRTLPIEVIEKSAYIPDCLTQEESYVLSCLHELPQKQRAAIYMHYVEDYSADEIAEILKIKKRTVDSLLYRGLKRLKNITKGSVCNG